MIFRYHVIIVSNAAISFDSNVLKEAKGFDEEKTPSETYITAVLEQFTKQFTVGDGKEYNYSNKSCGTKCESISEH